MKFTSFVFNLFLTIIVFSQETDTTIVSKKRLIAITATNVTLLSSSISYLNTVWYKDFPKTKFHTFNDASNWLQMDKLGHAFAAYHFTEVVSKSYRWTGISPKKSAWIGSAYALTFQSALEVMDAYNSQWGFSWSDMLANLLGSAMYAGQEYSFNKQLVKFKYSYYESGLAELRPDVLGSNFPEKLLKDYNAQTYWVSTSPFHWIPTKRNMKWLNIAIGYGIHNKLKGTENIYTTITGKTYQAERQFLVSFDIDVNELNIRKKWLKTLLSPINIIKVPMPTIYWSGKTFYGKLLF